MIVLGVDYSSVSTGMAVVVDGAPLYYAVWTPPKKATRPATLLDYDLTFNSWLSDKTIDLAMVEDPKVRRGYHTVRTLSHFESITYLVLERRRIPIRTAQPGEARRIVFGLSVTVSKDLVLEAVRERWPELRLPPVDRGGGDVADAIVQGVAGPEILRLQR